MSDDRVVELKSYRGYIAVEQCDLDFEEAIREAYAVNGPVVSLIAEFREQFQRVDPSIESLQAEVERLRKDRARYQWLANAVLCCDYGDNDQGGAESPDRIGWAIRLTRRNAEPFIFGQSIDAAIDQALAAKEQTR